VRAGREIEDILREPEPAPSQGRPPASGPAGDAPSSGWTETPDDSAAHI
jgi:hypothetical protein